MTFPHEWAKLKSIKKCKVAEVQNLSSNTDNIYRSQHLSQPMYDFEPQAVRHFLTFFTLVCIYGNMLKSGLRINKSHIGAAIFDRGVCENM